MVSEAYYVWNICYDYWADILAFSVLRNCKLVLKIKQQQPNQCLHVYAVFLREDQLWGQEATVSVSSPEKL